MVKLSRTLHNNKKMKKIRIILILPVTFFVLNANAQNFKGHLKLLNNLFIPHPDTLVWFNDQTIDNRLEFRWQAFDFLRLEAQARNRFIYGDFVEFISDYASFLDDNSSYLDLSFIWADERSFVGHTEFDRLFAQFSYHDIELTIGRQRVNWGIDLVWNPNDIFNTFSYLDIEYPERRGTDAITLKYYTGTLAFAELVFSPGRSADSSTYGVRYRTNILSTDAQIIAARMPTHYVIGGGFTSGLGQFAVRSEFSIFFKDNNNYSNGVLATLSADRSFGDGSFMQFGLLYNSFGSKNVREPLSLLQPRVQSPMMLSQGKVNLFVGFNTTIRTLFTPSISILANPSDGSAAIIPGIGYSASDNLTLALNGMLLTGNTNDEYPNFGQLAYFKVQWNF